MKPRRRGGKRLILPLVTSSVRVGTDPRQPWLPPTVIYGPSLAWDTPCLTIRFSCSYLESPPSPALELTESMQLL